MVHLAAVGPGTGAVDARAARGEHRWHFGEAEAAHLKAALPQLDWGRAGSEETVPYGEFMGLVASYATRTPCYDLVRD